MSLDTCTGMLVKTDFPEPFTTSQYGDDVGGLADAAGEDLGVLEDRRVDRLVAVAPEQLGGDSRQVLPDQRGRREACRRCPLGRGRQSSRDLDLSVGWADGRKCTARH